MERLSALARDLMGLFSDRLELLSLELERAGNALVQITVLLIAAAILGVTAWLAFWACITGALMALGLHWAAALAVVLVINAVAGALALRRVAALKPSLGLPATRRHLRFSVDPSPPAEDVTGSAKGSANQAAKEDVSGAVRDQQQR